MPGDPIIGFVTRGNGVSVHRARLHQRRLACCAQPERLIEVEWAPSARSVFLVQLQVEALDRNRLLSDVTRVLSDHARQHPVGGGHDLARPGGHARASPSRWATPAHLDHVIKAVRRIDGVFDVYRVTGGKATKPEPV